jgi:hypothetical protein
MIRFAIWCYRVNHILEIVFSVLATPPPADAMLKKKKSLLDERVSNQNLEISRENAGLCFVLLCSVNIVRGGGREFSVFKTGFLNSRCQGIWYLGKSHPGGTAFYVIL